MNLFKTFDDDLNYNYIESLESLLFVKMLRDSVNSFDILEILVIIFNVEEEF